MRTIHKRLTAVGVLAGAVMLAAGQSAMAQTTSPEGIGAEATGTVAVPATPDATSNDPDPASVASLGIDGLLTTNDITAQVSGNTTTAGIAGITALGGSPIAISSGAISSTCTANADGTFTESSTLADLTVPGLTIPADPAPNTTLSLPGIVTVTLNQQVAGPSTGSETVNALVFNFPLLNETITLASSTCGPYVAPAPMASGKGLAMGLGALGVAGAGVATVTMRRRRRATAA